MRKYISFVPAVIALIVAALGFLRIEQEAAKSLEVDRVGRYISTMESYHDNLVDLVNDYVLVIRDDTAAPEKTSNKFRANKIRESIRDTLSRLQTNKNNWMSLLDGESQGAVTIYSEKLKDVDAGLENAHDAETLEAFWETLLSLECARDEVSHQIERQFLGIETSYAPCPQEEEKCAQGNC